MKTLLLLVIMFMVYGYSYQATLRGVDYSSVRQAGMGMAYTAIANDEATLFVNPAGIGVKKRLFQIEEPDLITYFFPIKLAYSQNLLHSLVFSDPPLSDYISVGQNNLAYSVNIHSPTDLTIIGDFWGVSFFTRGIINIFNSDNIADIFGQFKVNSQLNVAFNVYSFSLVSNEDFHIGIGAKLLYLIQAEKLKSNLQIADQLNELFNNPTRRTMIDIISRNINYFEGFAFGIDVGLLWEIHLGDTEHQINLGVVMQDAPTYAFSTVLATHVVMEKIYSTLCKGLYEQVNITVGDVDELCRYERDSFTGADSWFYKFNLKTGIAYILPDFLGKFFSDTTVAFDVHRIGDTDYSFAEMYHVGISTTVFDATDTRTGYSYRMNLSLGVSQNQFNAGYLIHLNLYQIGYNYFREVIPQTGGRSIHRHELTFAFYF